MSVAGCHVNTKHNCCMYDLDYLVHVKIDYWSCRLYNLPTPFCPSLADIIAPGSVQSLSGASGRLQTSGVISCRLRAFDSCTWH